MTKPPRPLVDGVENLPKLRLFQVKLTKGMPLLCYLYKVFTTYLWVRTDRIYGRELMIVVITCSYGDEFMFVMFIILIMYNAFLDCRS